MINKRNPYLYQKHIVDRLLREYKQHKNLIIGVDFDDTIYDYHDQGFIFPETVDALKRAQELGCILCAWTSNKDEILVFKTWKQLGLRIDYYNQSPVVLHIDQIKPYFNLLLDDRAGLPSALYTLQLLIAKIKKENNNGN